MAQNRYQNTQINVRIEMYSGLSMVNDETYSNISLGSLYQTCEITRKYLKSIEHGANIDDQDYLSGNGPLHSLFLLDIREFWSC